MLGSATLGHWLRRIPLGHRMLLTVVLLAVAAAATALAAWRTVNIVTTHRAAVEAMRADGQRLGAVESQATRLQLLVRQYLGAPTLQLAAEVDGLSQRLLGEVDALAAGAGADAGVLAGAVRGYVEDFRQLARLNAEVAAAYETEIQKPSAETSGLFAILNHSNAHGQLDAPLAASLAKAGEAFTAALVNLNAYYFRGDPALAGKGRAQLEQLEGTVPVMLDLAGTNMQRNTLRAIAQRAGRLLDGIATLERLFAARAAVVAGQVDAQQQRIADAVARMVEGGRQREAALSAETERRTVAALTDAAAIGVAVLVVGLVIAFLIVESIRKPVLQLTEDMQALADGDWERRVTGQSHADEVGRAARTLEVFKRTAQEKQRLEAEKREALAREKADTERAFDQLAETHRELDRANRLVLESIRYARRIQTALLPDLRALDGMMDDIQVSWQPLDVVGGDYFWLERFAGPDGDTGLIAVIDCTGHGVPGAFMTMVVASALDRILHEMRLRTPSEILEHLDRMVRLRLRQDRPDAESDDGLDAAVCVYDLAAGTLTYAGASIPLLFTVGAEVVEIKGSRASLGYRSQPPSERFTDHRIAVEPGTTFYLLTDGVHDHVGGARRRLLGRRRFAAMIRERLALPLAAQIVQLEAALDDYRGVEPRRDDMTLVGFRPRPAVPAGSVSV